MNAPPVKRKKRTLYLQVKTICEKYNFDPIEYAIWIATNDKERLSSKARKQHRDVPMQVRMQAVKEILKYRYQQLQSINVVVDNDTGEVKSIPTDNLSLDDKKQLEALFKKAAELTPAALQEGLQSNGAMVSSGDGPGVIIDHDSDNSNFDLDDLL